MPGAGGGEGVGDGGETTSWVGRFIWRDDNILDRGSDYTTL